MSSNKNFCLENMFHPKKISNLNESSLKVTDNVLRNLRNEVFIIYFKEKNILTLNSSDTYGYSIILGNSFSS